MLNALSAGLILTGTESIYPQEEAKKWQQYLEPRVQFIPKKDEKNSSQC